MAIDFFLETIHVEMNGDITRSAAKDKGHYKATMNAVVMTIPIDNIAYKKLTLYR